VPPYIKRKLAFYDLLGEEQLEQLDTQVDWLLENIGFAFRDDPESLRIWKEAGVKMDGDKVFADAVWVREQCAKAPSEFTQLGRNPERTVTIGGNNQVFAPIYGAPFVRDLKGGRRYATFGDFEKLLEKSRAQDSVDMAEILHGKETMDNNVVIMANVNTNSPLLIDRVVTEAIQVYSSRGQAMVITPFILTGAMGPVSTAAAIAQAMAEAMITIAFGQFVALVCHYAVVAL